MKSGLYLASATEEFHADDQTGERIAFEPTLEELAVIAERYLILFLAYFDAAPSLQSRDWCDHVRTVSERLGLLQKALGEARFAEISESAEESWRIGCQDLGQTGRRQTEA